MRSRTGWKITTADFSRLLRSYIAGDKDAMGKLIVGMMPVIGGVAKKFRGYAELADLLQQGIQALIEVLPELDPNGTPLKYSQLYISSVIRSYCLIACPVSRPLVMTKGNQLVSAARVVSWGDLDWVYDKTKVNEIEPVWNSDSRKRCPGCKRYVVKECKACTRATA